MGGLFVARAVRGFCKAPIYAESAIRALQSRLEAAEAQVERLTIRGTAYENAYRIAYQATYQSHNGHWDATMQGGKGCRECIRAQEARENCDKELRDGLEALAARTAGTGESTKQGTS